MDGECSQLIATAPLQTEAELWSGKAESAGGTFPGSPPPTLESHFITLTKKGQPRKRRKFVFSVEQRKELKHRKLVESHAPIFCDSCCKKKCINVISIKQRNTINRQFWMMAKSQQKKFILNSTTRTEVKRKTVGENSRRSYSFKYFLKDEAGKLHSVCKIMLLNTLGYKNKNDKIFSFMSKDTERIPFSGNKLNREITGEHIEPFQPDAAHCDSCRSPGNSDISTEDGSHSPTVESQIIALTRKGEPRKRRKFALSAEQQKELKHKLIQSRAPIFCDFCCKKRCWEIISTKQRNTINRQYWMMTKSQQKKFILNSTTRTEVKTKTVGENSRRSYSFKYSLKDEVGNVNSVCKVILLNTLGYKNRNDKIFSFMSKDLEEIQPNYYEGEIRGKTPHNKINPEIITKHIELFHPEASPYASQHSPARRYLPSDVTIMDMYNDFNRKYVDYSSYDLYRLKVKSLNISSAKAKHEECDTCERCNVHKHKKEDLDTKCQSCRHRVKHEAKHLAASRQYAGDAQRPLWAHQLVYSLDLQKVVRLPRCQATAKTISLVERITAYNLSFVPVGNQTQISKPSTFLWHEGVSGTKDEDIISALYKFLLNQRDCREIILWAYNSFTATRSQMFLSFLVYIINSLKINAETITVKYLERGHGQLSTEVFHQQVEKTLHKIKNIYDFDDFKDAVQNSNSGEVKMFEMNFTEFYSWVNLFPKKKKKMLKKINFYEVVQFVSKRGENTLTYKKEFGGADYILDFMLPQVDSTIPDPVARTKPRGVPRTRKEHLVSHLTNPDSHIIPATKAHFWENLPISCK